MIIRRLHAMEMVGYALGRGLVNEDYCLIDRLVTELKQNDYRARVLIEGIVLSKSFRYRPGTPELRLEPVPEETAATGERP